MTSVSPRPVVSTIICTRNRARHLAAALESVVAQLDGAPPSEIIVVDNASTDGTREVVRRFESTWQIRYLHESTLGLCHARNTGWQQALGQYVAYLDDDAVAGPGWLASVPAAFESLPAAGVVGGRVDPLWEGPRPSWLSDEVTKSLTVVDWSGTPKVIQDLSSQWLVGANMAVRADVLREVGGFHPSLDRAGSGMLSSGDVFLQKEVVKRGHACLYYPAMAVQHLVPFSRMNKRWFRRRYYWQGISDATMELLEESPTAAQRLARAARSAAQLLASPRRLGTLLPTDDPDRFTMQCWTWIEVGHIAGLLGAAGRS